MTMNLVAISVLLSLCDGFVWCSHIDLALKQSMLDESVIPGKIINNYLGKYISNSEIFVSVIVSPSREEQNRFRDDFSYNLVNAVASAGFAYSVLNKLNNDTGHNWNAFNIILAHDSTALQ